MEFPKNKALNKDVNRKELVHREVLEKYADLKTRLINLFEQTAKKAVTNIGEDLASQKHESERDAPAVNMVSKEVVNQDAGRNLENAFENAHNQPKVLGESIRPVFAHCSTNPPPTQPLTPTTTCPTDIQPEAVNPFRRSLILVEAQSKLKAKANFHPICFKGIEQQLANLRAVSSTCMSALELCIDKIVELNNGIVSLQQKGSQFGKYQQGRLNVEVTTKDNVANIQAGFAQLRSLSILLNNSTQRIQRDGYGFVQLNNSSGELSQTEEQVRNDVSQVLTQLTEFRNRWEEQMDDIRQLILVSEFLKQDAIERYQDVKNVHKSLEELKAAETSLHNQCLELNEAIHDICGDLKKNLGGEGYEVKGALHVNTASKFDMLDETVRQLETSMDELRNEVRNQFGELKQSLERLATKIGKLRKDFSGFTRNTKMDDALSYAKGELGSSEQPVEGQGSTVPPIRSSVNEGAVNIPDSPVSDNIVVVASSFSTRQTSIASVHPRVEMSNFQTQEASIIGVNQWNSEHVVGAGVKPNREVELLQKIVLPIMLEMNKKVDKLEKATSSQRKPVGNDESSSNEVQTTLGTRFSTAAASTSAKRVLDMDLESPYARPDPKPKRLTQHRLVPPTLNAFSSSSESLESPSKNEYSSDLFKEWRNGRV